MKIAVFLTLFILSTSAFGRVDVADTEPIILPEEMLAMNLNRQDMGRIIPTNMEATDSAGAVARRIGDHAFHHWLLTSEAKNSTFFRTASKVENSMKTEVSIKSDKEGGVDHKVSFQYLAFQAMTKIKYSGWLNAVMDYDARLGTSFIELSEKIWKNKDLFWTRTASSYEEISSVGIRWSW